MILKGLQAIILGLSLLGSTLNAAINPPDTTGKPVTEDDFYKIITLPIPQGIKMEVGGLAVLPNGRLAVSTRRGEVWMVDNPYMEGNTFPTYKRFAHGMHENLGLAYVDGDFYLTQRSELTRLKDLDGDDVADVYEKVFSWPVSGNYHEYSYGPVVLPNKDMLVTLNLSWIGKGASLAKWRGWLLKITPEGKMTPVAAGLRSPAGFNTLKNGDIFYTENQGDWVGSGRMTHLSSGDFAGNPASLIWSGEEGSPVKLKPSDIPDTGETLFDAAKKVPGIKVPAIWFPHSIMGISTSAILEDTIGTSFGPFEGQVFVGDQGHSKIMRVALEKVKGVYQGACFPFREGFSSGVLRLNWGLDNSMFVGMTSRGWSSTGKEEFGLQRLVWTGATPFEMKNIKAQPDGFEVEFTIPVDIKKASDPASYEVTGFNYKYHHAYGSPIIGQEECPIRGVVVSADGLKARLVVDNIREGYIHQLKAEGVKSKNGNRLLHNVGYYTLNNIPEGEKLKISSPANTHNHALMKAYKASTKGATLTKAAPTAKHTTKMPISWTNGPDQTITIGTKPGLKFDLTQVEVKAGSKIKWVFNNKDDMLHNCVIVAPGTANEVGQMSINMGLDGPKKGYIPETDKVLFHTSLMQPVTSEAIYFVAPEKPGDYTYVCTLPGHSFVMQGKLKVVQ